MYNFSYKGVVVKENNIGDLILLEMKKKPKNTIFTVSDFYDLGSKSAVKTALFRLANEGILHRLIDGYYVIPSYSELIKEFGYPSENELAKKIAERFAWTITPCGENALNQVGISTQVPYTCEYVSDGPYREYQYGDKIIKFKHTSNRSIKNYSMPLAILIQSIKAIGEQNINDQHILIMSLFVKRYIHEDIIKDTKSLPAWIYEILKRVKEKIENE